MSGGTAQLLCRARPGVTLAFTLDASDTVVGRDPELPVSVPLDGVSRRHAKIGFDGKHYWLEDLTSTNGTFLNGQPIQRQRLRSLDVITLGKAVDLVFIVRAPGAAAVTTRGIVKAWLVEEDAEVAAIPAGEFVLGRSSACNLVVESGTVSKLHAKIIRTMDQLVLQDLGSGNGTFVNGNRVMSAVLRDGDLLSLGGVASFQVRVELGEVTSATEVRRAFRPEMLAPAAAAVGDLSTEWKTRYEWDPAEREALAAVLAQVAAEREATRGTAPAPAAPGKRAATPKGTPPVAAASGSAARPPAAPAPPPIPASAVPPAEPAPGATPAAGSSMTAKPPGRAPAAAPAPPPAAAPAVAPAAASDTRPIAGIHLEGAGLDGWIREPGVYEIGRAVTAAFHVADPTVSRRHAAIELLADRSAAWVAELGAANRTRVNGQEVEARRRLADGDTIGLGDVRITVTFERR
jgi:pSer/pThr/pTyr-binding forkhead associated (FHA) protein